MEGGRKETNFLTALTCSRSYTHGALDGPEVSRVFGCVFLRTKVVIVSEVCRGCKANIVLCESEWKEKARLRQKPMLVLQALEFNCMKKRLCGCLQVLEENLIASRKKKRTTTIFMDMYNEWYVTVCSVPTKSP